MSVFDVVRQKGKRYVAGLHLIEAMTTQPIQRMILVLHSFHIP